ncbi:MAG TPA: hypothetical protein VKO86_01585 [Gemmatimonadales bacterium]|nr:hypothetical protein [Gemmatimonadales bacterium]
MPDSISLKDYYYTTVPDKPGEGVRVLNVLRSAGVNLLAYSGFPEARRTQIDFVPEDAAAFLAAAKAAKIKLTGPKKVFLISGEDRPGAVAGLYEKLAAAKINVTATDAVCAGMGRYGAILWVKPRDVKKAAKVLGVNSP